jgi:acyl-CoA synthetase (NDP forming)
LKTAKDLSRPLGAKYNGELRPMTLDAIFYPRSIAVVGAAPGPFNPHTQIFLYTLVELGFKGEIYPINPRAEDILGFKAYRNVRDVPGPVDYVICIIPASGTRQLVEDCVAKGVKALHLYTAGFAETGDDEKGRLQKELVETARKGGLRIIGPNCMGVYNARSGMSYAPGFPEEPGNVAFISQSGSYSLLVVRGAAARGVRFSKVVSYGNASDINEVDLLDYLADDPETGVIGVYLEGTRDGDGLGRAMKKAASKKPLIVIKKGVTEAGKRGASSHTGAMAGDDSVWDGFIRQTGAIRVEDFEEMIDLITTFAFMPVPRGLKAVLLGVGGGASVRSSDECEQAGLTLPPLPESLQSEIGQVVPPAGSMLRNPIDPGHYAHDWTSLLRIVDAWPGADMILWQVAPDIEALQREPFIQYVNDKRRHILEVLRTLDKPKAVIVHGGESEKGLSVFADTRRMCQEAGIPFYPSIYRAAKAIKRFVNFHSRV